MAESSALQAINIPPDSDLSPSLIKTPKSLQIDSDAATDPEVVSLPSYDNDRGRHGIVPSWNVNVNANSNSDMIMPVNPRPKLRDQKSNASTTRKIIDVAPIL